MAEKPHTSDLWTVEEMAERFHVTKQTIGSWNDNGTLPRGIRLGHRWYWRKADIERYLDKLAGKK